MIGLETLPEERKRFLILGDVSALFLNSKYHQQFRLSEMWRVVGMPLNLGQYRIYYNSKNLPIAFVSWARLSDEVSEKYEKGNYRLQDSEWNSGENLWLIDFISPFGNGKKVFLDLYKNIFGNEKSAKFIRREVNGSMKKVVHLTRK